MTTSSDTTATTRNLFEILVLPGDGVGPEVVAQAVRVIDSVQNIRSLQNHVNFNLNFKLIGGAAIDQFGSALPQETLMAAKKADAILLGAVGGPQWLKPPTKENPNPARPEQGLLQIRKELDLFANIRPCIFPSKSLIEHSPLKPSVVQDTHFIVVRELTGGIYFGKREETNQQGVAYDTMVYSVDEVKRIARIAGQLATLNPNAPPLPVTSIDKANVLATSRLWRQVVTDTLAREFPTVPLSHQLVDSAAMHMVMNPKRLNGIVLTENMFGDILSDEASVIPGSLGLLPSASLSGWNNTNGSCARSVGLYEPIHGSAPDIAGKGIANPIGTILSVAMMFRYSFGLEKEAVAIEKAVEECLDKGFRSADLGGNATTAQIGDAVIQELEIILNEHNQIDLASHVQLNEKTGRLIPSSLPFKRRPMTLCEKIICQAAIGLPAPYHVQPGDMVCVAVDWTIASELTWKGMEKTFNEMKRPKIHRNDRFWLAIDHTVDPSIYHLDKPKQLIKASEEFAKEAELTDFWGPNQTILHTEFYRERAQPGMMIIGADSHSCSAGGLGTFAVGLGAADVVMPLVTGETWFKVPETCEVRFVGEPSFGIGGKDVILYVLGVLRRNTVAFERAVEWTGPGLKHLSCDSRFAIANMTTEFGGIAGVFEADEITAAYISKRKAHKNEAIYFRADEGAQYAESHVIDLSEVDSMVALYPSPDNVVHVSKVANMELDGCFIGACTTAEEDLILAALVLEKGMELGCTPVMKGKRKVTPGSVSIVAKLRRLGLLDVYQKAGFEIGAPGCSYCLGIAADRAGEGEVWLSSQNRNFKNRMGKGSIGNLASAATVAASSFEMKVRDPRALLDAIDKKRFQDMLEIWTEECKVVMNQKLEISEPSPLIQTPKKEGVVSGQDDQVSNDNNYNSSGNSSKTATMKYEPTIEGKVQRFGDHIDTDAIIPAEFMPGTSDEDLGTHCFQYVKPDFRRKVKEGRTIVVAGVGFGSGSSREEAPRALKGSGVKAVIAKSYAYIYGRNQPNMALLGVIVKDEEFYELAQDGVSVVLNKQNRTVSVDGGKQTFGFELSFMEQVLIEGGGVTDLYKEYGRSLFRKAIEKSHDMEKSCSGAVAGSDEKNSSCGKDEKLNW